MSKWDPHFYICVRLSTFPSGSLNHATRAPDGEFQIPLLSWSIPGKRSKRAPLAYSPDTVAVMSRTFQPSAVYGNVSAQDYSVSVVTGTISAGVIGVVA